MKRSIFLAAAVAATLACACKPVAENSGPVLTTQAVELTDSLNYGRSSAEVTISGQYPDSGVPVLVDSCRQWLADCLCRGAFDSRKPLIHPTAAELVAPQRLLGHLAKKMLDSARRDFLEFEADPELSVGYEYQISFEPTWISDSVVSYSYTAYAYQGGAHGATSTLTASKSVSTGRTLTYAYAFMPDRRKELVAKIRQALWNQYFQPLGGNDPAAPQTIDDALLINPAELDLPADNPKFGPDGVSFTYGQYDIAAYAFGQPSCTLSYSELAPLMTPAALHLLNLR